MKQDVFARLVCRQGWEVHIPRPVLAMVHYSLPGQDAQDRAHRRVRRRVGKPLHDLGHGRFTLTMQDLHDLTLSTAQVFGEGTLGHGYGSSLHSSSDPGRESNADKSAVLIIQHDLPESQMFFYGR